MTDESWVRPFEVFGAWSELTTPDRQVSGRLTCDPVSGLELETSDGRWLSAGMDFDNSLHLHGLCGRERWTLVDCLLVQSSGAGERYRVGYALQGGWFDADEVLLLDEIQVEFDDGWSAVAPSPRGPRHQGAPSVLLEASVAPGVTVAVTSELVPVTMDTPASFGFSDRLRFGCRLETPTTFRELTRLFLEPMQDLVCLSLQRDVAVTFCGVAGDGTTQFSRGQRVRRELIPVYWNRVRGKRPAEPRPVRPLLKLPADPDAFDRLLSSWFDLHRSIELPVDLRLIDLIDGFSFADPKLLMAAQSLEALHRRLHPGIVSAEGRAAREAALAATDHAHRSTLQTLLTHAHEPTFRQRLRSLAEHAEPEFGQIIGADNVKWAIGQLVDARNAVTHWAPNTISPDGLTMVALRMVADALFDLSVIKRLTLPEGAIEDAIQAHRSKQVEYWVSRARTSRIDPES